LQSGIARRATSSFFNSLSISHLLRTKPHHFQSTMSAVATTASTLTTGTKVWFITGCSTGFGRQIAIAARKHGDLVIATARKLSAIEDLQQIGCHTLALDVTADDEVVKHVVAEAHAIHGRIDILVNNAGVGLVGPTEETSTAAVTSLFGVNVFGLLRVTRAVLPFLRKQRSGIIANIGSVSGRAAFPSLGVYCASKFAVAAISQALAAELASFNINVTVVEPGSFSTEGFNALDFDSSPSIDDYVPLMSAVASGGLGSIPGDPAKGAQAIVEALTLTGRAAGRELPVRLLLGGDVLDAMQPTVERDQKELNTWKDFTNAEWFAFDGEQS